MNKKQIRNYHLDLRMKLSTADLNTFSNKINTNIIDQAVTFLKEINSESYAYDFWAKDALLSLDSLLEDINERIKALLFFLKEISNLEFEHFIYDKLLPYPVSRLPSQ